MEIKISNRQREKGITDNLICWECENKFGYLPDLVITGNVIKVLNNNAEEISDFIKNLNNPTTEDAKEVLIETINQRERTMAIKKVLPDVKVFYRPGAIGCLNKGTYENYQRWYFSRKLTKEEKIKVLNAISLIREWKDGR